jgi:Cytochrome c554 and c-prime
MLPTEASREESAAARGAGSPGGSCCRVGRGTGFVLAALGLTLVSVLGATGLARWLRTPPVQEKSAAPEGPALFHGWPAKLEMAFLLSGQMHGYMLPCGCSDPQLGGLERRYNFLQELKAKGWPIVALDMGDIPQKHGPVTLPNHQGRIKYRYSMTALQKMDYSAVSFGEYEAGLPLMDALAEWALQFPTPPFVSANLSEPDFKPCVLPWVQTTAKGSQASVGVTAIVGPSVIAQIKDPMVKFAPTEKTLPDVLKLMTAKKVDLRVLLYHGSMETPAKGFKEPEAIALAKAFPELDLILCLSESDEPAGQPTMVQHAAGRKTMVVSLGHKSKYVGVVGVFATGEKATPYELRYELVQLSPHYATPPAKVKDHPIIELMEEYTRELKKANYLEQVSQSKHPNQVAIPGVTPTYVGSDACKGCHKSAYKVWEKSTHSIAYQGSKEHHGLVDAKQPSLRQFDPECIVCHSVGYGYQSGFVSTQKTPKLTDVGCESCHGPASEHVKNQKDPQLMGNDPWPALMNPWKAPEKETPAAKDKRLLRIDRFCQGCHDIDNDVTWTHGGFNRKWPLIAHPND